MALRIVLAEIASCVWPSNSTQIRFQVNHGVCDTNFIATDEAERIPAGLLVVKLIGDHCVAKERSILSVILKAHC
jgi:hypothetical protein